MYRIFNHFTPRIATLLVLFELPVFVVATYLAAYIRFTDPLDEITGQSPYFGLSALVFGCLTSLSLAAFGVYELHSRHKLGTALLRVIPAMALGSCLTVVVFYALPDLYLGRGVLALAVGFSLVGVLLMRLLSFQFFKSRFLRARILFLGATEQAAECIELSGRNSFRERYQVVGVVPLRTDERVVGSTFLLPRDGTLLDIARRYEVDEIVISQRNWREPGIPVHELLQCKLHGITVTPISRFFEREINQLQLPYLQPSTMVFDDGFQERRLPAIAKRAVDILAASALLVATLPVMLLAALAIVLEDGSPVLYRQERVGRHGRRFMVLKFRSMRRDAESGGVPTWAAVGDSRVTRVGAFLRKTRIDELPQIFNVLKGEMSFVGPRPERPYFVDQLSAQIPYYGLRHSIKPGITGFAQVRYPYGATAEDAVQKLQYELYYIKNQSLFLDLLIIIDTIQVVLFAKGSR